MFETKNIYYYLFVFSVVTVVGYFGSKVRQQFDNGDEYELIRKYLLNDSPLYGYNRPKIWIHTKYEKNARKWKSFYSRNSYDLNEPYIHLTIKTIINHCGKDFNICLIDDETFSKLIPSWKIDLTKCPEPMKQRWREIGMLELVYYYGGMVVPNTFLCTRNLKGFYEENISQNKPFVLENVNNTVNIAKRKNKTLFAPDLYFYGSQKNSEAIKRILEYLKYRNPSQHFTSEFELLGDTSEKVLSMIQAGEVVLVDGVKVGVKTQKGKPVVIDDLLEESFIDFSNTMVGIYIPNEDVLNRTKYQWFAVMSGEQILASPFMVAKYLKASIVDSTSEYNNSSVLPSVVAL
jgi:hypothetical protein